MLLMAWTTRGTFLRALTPGFDGLETRVTR
jgi:hypothetical protein